MTHFTHCKVCLGAIAPENEKFELSRCLDCGLIFCNRIFSQAEFIEVYDRLYNSANAIYSNHSVMEFAMLKGSGPVKIGRKREAMIRQHVIRARKKSVLEIGSGIGLIGTYFKRNAADIKYKGIEIDEQSFLKSRELGLDTMNGDFTLMASLSDEYDVIMLWEVLEHLQDLRQFLDLAIKKLRPGGVLLLSTPNYDKILNYPNRPKDAIYQDQPPIHLNFFTRDSLKQIFQIAGFANVEVTVKAFPYFKPSSVTFYRDVFRALLGKYQGSTVYVKASKS